MALLPSSYDPFEAPNAFRDLDIDLFDSDAALQKRIESLSAEMDGLDEEQKNRRVQQFQDALKVLRNARQRAVAAVVQIDHLSDDLVMRRLEEAGELKPEEFALDDADINQVLIEGEDLSLAAPDFGEVAIEDAMMIQIEDIIEIAGEDHGDRSFNFEL
jgi:hypothetical protein